MRLKCYPDSTSTSAALYFNGLADYWEMKFLLAYLRPGDNFLDVGANAGVYSVLAAICVGSEGSVDAIEPMEVMARRIEEQAALNGFENVQLHRLVVSDQNADIQFGFSTNDAMMHIRRDKETERNGTLLRSIRLDDFLPGKQYAMGKMDIEGAEPLALAGSVDMLGQSNPPVWLLELAGCSEHYGVSTDRVISQLDAAGYECGIYEPERGRIHFTSEPWKYGVQNVLAVSTSQRNAVEMRIAETGND